MNGSLSSITETQVLQGSNYALLGDEIIQFANATLNADGTYTLDTLVRGRRGTEWAAATHVANENFVLLNDSMLRRVDAQINIERDYKAVTFGTFIDAATQEVKTNTGASQKPFSVSFLKGRRNGSLDLIITWQRRSRYIGTPLNYLPLDEESESYEIDIMDGATVKRTLTATSETKTYAVADQITDFGAAQSALTIRAYQLSAVIGRGTVNEENV